MTRAIALPLTFLALAACAGTGADYRPILDGPPAPGFAVDLEACRALARDQRQFDQETLAAAVLGAGAGAAIGALDPVTGPLGGAVAGALASGIASAVTASEKREAIVIACLKGRGHPVVG